MWPGCTHAERHCVRVSEALGAPGIGNAFNQSLESRVMSPCVQLKAGMAYQGSTCIVRTACVAGGLWGGEMCRKSRRGPSACCSLGQCPPRSVVVVAMTINLFLSGLFILCGLLDSPQGSCACRKGGGRKCQNCCAKKTIIYRTVGALKPRRLLCDA